MINKELILLLISRILQVVIAFLSIQLLTRYLKVSEMGNYYLIMSIVGLYGFFLINPIGQYINRYTHKWYKENRILNIYFIFNFYVILMSFVALGLTYILYQFGIGSNINLFYFIIFICLYVFFNTWNQTIIPMINLLGNIVPFIVFTIFTQILALFLSFLCIKYLELKAIFWFLGQVMGFGIVAIFSLVYFINKIQANFYLKDIINSIKISSIKSIIKFSLPLSVGVFFLWMQIQSYSIIVEKYIGAEFLGFIGVGFALAFTISSSFETIVMQYIYPKIYKNMDDKSKFQNIINDIFNLISPIYFLLALFVSFFATYFITIVVDVKYYSSYMYTIFGIWISFFRMLTNLVSNIANAKLNTKKLILPYAVGGILSIIGVFISIQFENYQYFIPFSLLLASLCGFIVMFLKMNKLVKIKIKFKFYITVVLYSIPFMIGIYFYKFAHIIEYALIITILFGIYFLFIIYMLSKKIGVKFE